MHPALRLLLLLLFTLPVHAQTDIVGVYLTWQRDPTTTMTVNWVNLYPDTPATVWYRASSEPLWRSADGTHRVVKPSVLQHRQVELTGLQPDTEYQFALTTDPGDNHKEVRKFRTLPATLQRPLRFVTGGDMMHNRAYVDAMNKQASAQNPAFALLGGDLAYADGKNATRWFHWLESWSQNAVTKDGLSIPMVVCIGNHEVRGGYDGKIPEDAPYFYGLFTLPGGRSYYALDVADYLSLIVLDSGHTQPVAGAQTGWLAQALHSRAGQRFLFPVYHYPAYGTAKAPEGQLPCESPRAIHIRTHWIPHFERHGVSAVFENDHHNYKRTHPLRNHQRDDKNGITYLGDGAWGVSTRTVPKDAWYLAHTEPRRHLFTITLHPDGTLQARAVDAKGEVFDQVKFKRSRTVPGE